MGQAAFNLRPLHERLLGKLHNGQSCSPRADDAVLDPGRGRTKTGQLWAYAADDRPWGGAVPPVVAYVYAPDRKADRPVAHLAGFKGVLLVDGYAGYGKLGKRCEVQLAFCWSHMRRNQLATPGSHAHRERGASAHRRVLRIEKDIRGRSAKERRLVRQQKSRQLAEGLERWLRAELALISQKGKLAMPSAMRSRAGKVLTLFIDDGRLELDNNAVERSIRPIALNRKNTLFAGSDGGAEHWAIIASLVETSKLNESIRSPS
ncbi:hypothetical protein ACVWW6_000033 [Bradyrhizobium sp. USDA 3311]